MEKIKDIIGEINWWILRRLMDYFHWLNLGNKYETRAVTKNLNIRVYKTSSGAYQTKSSDDRGSGNSSNIESIASQVKFSVESHFKKVGFSQVTIDCSPFHEIEVANGLAYQKLLPLSEKEKEDLFNKLKK